MQNNLEYLELKRDGKEKLPIELYTQKNINEARESLENDPFFQRFYTNLLKYDVYALHKTSSTAQILKDKAIKSLKLTNNNCRTEKEDIEFFNNHGFVFT
jgi:hypothetical protein